MRSPPLLLLVLATAALTASYGASARAGGLPVCNGKHKRSANPYGSVLSQGLKPVFSAATSPKAPQDRAGDAAANTSEPSAASQKVSRADARGSFAPCGDRA